MFARLRLFLPAVIAAALLPVPTAFAAAPTTLYVAPAGSDSNACTTKVEPCHTIGHAISLAANSGTTIHLAKGHYNEAVDPGGKHVSVVGAGTDHATGSVVADLGAGVVVDNPAGALTLKSLAFGGDPFGAYVTAGALTTSHTSLDDTRCAIVLTGGKITFTDSAVTRSGVVTDSDCRQLVSSPAAVTVAGGTLSFVRSRLLDTEDEPGIVVSDGTFSATGSQFSDQAYAQSNTNPTVQIAGGAATIRRSLFYYNFIGLSLTGGSTTVSDSTFNLHQYGIVSSGGGHQPTVLRSTLVDSQLYGPAVLAGDVLTTTQNVPTCSEEPTDMGYNYGTGGSCTFSAPTSHSGIATMNLDLTAANHGGPTRTDAQSAPSALIDAIPATATWGPEHKRLCPTGSTDQRGLPRPQGGACDAGAFEAAATRTAVTAAPDHASPGARVTVTATVLRATGTFHDPDALLGKVKFTAAGKTLCAAVAVQAGVAKCATTKLPKGRDTVRAAFSSASPYRGSAGSVTAVIGQA